MSVMPLAGWDREESPFHAGEVAIQRRLGIDEKIDRAGRRIIRTFMPDQHREFFAQLPFILVGSVDGSGQPWASMLTGRPGFLATPDDRTLTIAAQPVPGDPLTLVPGAAVGLLGIEPPTRRRNRANGTVSRADTGGITVAIQQSFGNCPKYIQARTAEPIEAAPSTRPPRVSPGLDEADRALIAAADTFFIATAHLSGETGRGADVSHRGGKPGFVRVEGNRLTVPDFVGNFLFNTLGNLALEPRAGLLFPDYATGDLLSLATTGEIIWDGPEVATFEGAQRLMRFDVTQAVRLPGALPFRWSDAEYSPALERTGMWAATPG